MTFTVIDVIRELRHDADEIEESDVERAFAYRSAADMLSGLLREAEAELDDEDSFGDVADIDYFGET